MRRLSTNLLLLGISIAIIVGLIVWTQKQDPQTFQRMLNQPKRWDQLVLALGVCLGGVLLSFVRWYYLVRALDLPFRLHDALRLGFLGFFFNFFSLGSVGGDLFKAVFIAREHPERRPEAVATVVIDRVIGLYALLVLSTIAILMTGLHHSPVSQIRLLCLGTFAFTGTGLAAIIVLLVPGFTTGVLSGMLGRLPKVGPIFQKLIAAIRMYRQRWPVVLLTGVLSLGVHSFLAVGIYLIAQALPGRSPGFGAHFVIVPLSMLTGVLPLPASGLGAFEVALEFLYLQLPEAGLSSTRGQGLLVALTYRMITIAIALIGAFYYFSARREMAQVIEQAQAEEQLAEV